MWNTTEISFIMKLEDLLKISTKKDFITYMKNYGGHVVILFGEYYGIRNVNIDLDMFEIITFMEKHRPNWYNDTEIERKQVDVKECLELLRSVRNKQFRKEKLERLCGNQ